MFELGGIVGQLQQLADQVRAADGATVPAAEWVRLVEQAQAGMNVLAAAQTVALAQLAGTDEDVDAAGELVEVYRGLGHHRLDAPDLVSAALGLTATAAATKVATAVDLATRHPGVIEAMATGRLDAWRASVICEELADATAETCTRVLERLGEKLGSEPAGALRRRLRRVLASVDADAVRAKAARARSQRSLRRTAFGLGVDEWSATLPVEDSRAAWSVIDSLARTYVTQGRCAGIEAARADALLDLIHARATGHLDLHLTVPASVLAAAEVDPDRDGTGCDSHAGADDHDGEVLVPVTGFGTTGTTHVRASWLASLAGPTVVRSAAAADGSSSGANRECGRGPAATSPARRTPALGVRAESRTSVVACADGTGALASLPIEAGLDRASRRRAQRAARRRVKRLAQLADRLHGRRGDDQGKVEPYRPPAWMVEFVKARDGACRFPGCTVAARFCDVDHVRPWPAGPTHPDNMVCLCRRHHRVKQRRGWRVQLHPDGTLTWTDPTGTVRTTTPVDHLQRGEEVAESSVPPAPEAAPWPAPAQAVERSAPPTPRGDDVRATVPAVATELPSLLEEELEHRHDHHLINLACRPTALTWRNRQALRAGTRVSTSRAAAQLHATTAAGIELTPPRRPMHLDRDGPHWHGPPTQPRTGAPPEDPPPF